MLIVSSYRNFICMEIRCHSIHNWTSIIFLIYFLKKPFFYFNSQFLQYILHLTFYYTVHTIKISYKIIFILSIVTATQCHSHSQPHPSPTTSNLLLPSKHNPSSLVQTSPTPNPSSSMPPKRNCLEPKSKSNPTSDQPHMAILATHKPTPHSKTQINATRFDPMPHNSNPKSTHAN